MNTKYLMAAIAMAGLLSAGGIAHAASLLPSLSRPAPSEISNDEDNVPLTLKPLEEFKEYVLARESWSSPDGQDWGIIVRQTGRGGVIYLSQQACERWLLAGTSQKGLFFWLNGSRPEDAECRVGVNKAVYDDLMLDAKDVESALLKASPRNR